MSKHIHRQTFWERLYLMTVDKWLQRRTHQVK
jgi:hypothetical protein